MKKGLLQTLFISSIFLINLVSASFHYGYGRFSFRGFIDGFDPVTLSLGLLFIVFLLVLNNLVFINLFRDQKGAAFVVSASISLLAVYWMYQKGLYLDEAIIFPVLIASMAVIVISYILINGFKMNRAMSIIIAVAISGAIAFWAYTSNFSLPSDILFPIVSFLLALGVIISIWKKKFSWLLIISGLLLILTTIFTDIFYEKGIALIAGIVLLVLGIFLKRRGEISNEDGANQQEEERRREISRGREVEAYQENSRREKRARNRQQRQQNQQQQTQANQQRAQAQRQTSMEKAKKAAYEEDAKRNKINKIKLRNNKDLKRRYERIMKRLNSMPGGSNIKKGSPGYKEYISLYREAESIRNQIKSLN